MLVKFKPVSGRYIRWWSSHSTRNGGIHFIELEAYTKTDTANCFDICGQKFDDGKTVMHSGTRPHSRVVSLKVLPGYALNVYTGACRGKWNYGSKDQQKVSRQRL